MVVDEAKMDRSLVVFNDRAIDNSGKASDLLGRPESRRMGRHIKMDHLPPVMEQNNEAVQHVEGHSGHREEVNSYNLSDMIGQKTLPGL